MKDNREWRSVTLSILIVAVASTAIFAISHVSQFADILSGTSPLSQLALTLPWQQLPLVPTPLPSPPANFSASTSGYGTNSIRLSWTPVTGATSYTIHRGTSPSNLPDKSPGYTTTTAYDTTVTNGTTYYYAVSTVSAQGESAYSAIVSVKAANCSYSLSPTATSTLAAASTGSFTVTITGGTGCSFTTTTTGNWISVTASGAAATIFDIFSWKNLMAAVGSANPWGGETKIKLNYTIAANSGPARTGMVNVLGTNTVYGTYTFPFKVTQAGAGPTVPAAPSNVVATAVSSSQINLIWTDNATDETTYKVERSPDNTTWTILSSVLPISATSFSDISLSASTKYYYRVKATNAAGDSWPSNTANATTLSVLSALPPAVPNNLSATPVTNSQINLSWTDNATNEDTYIVERSPDDSTWTGLTSTLPANTTSYSDTGLVGGTKYYYRVRSTNTNGDSAPSNTANATTLSVPIPAVPNNLSATPVTNSQINLSWTDNATNETSYILEFLQNTPGWLLLTTLPADTTSYSSTGLATNKKYFFRVKAFNSTGESAPSTVVSATTLVALSPLPGPNNLTATVISNSQINLSWTDNASDETAYRVERSTDGAAWTTLTSTLPANTTSYMDTGLETYSKYYYQVKASKPTGDSAPSNRVNATTASATLPTDPTNLTAIGVSSNEIDLSWTDNASNETAYKVERSPDDSTWTVLTSTLPANTTSYSDTGVNSGSTYFYRVIVIFGLTNSSPSNMAFATTYQGPAVTVPAGPQNLVATVISNSQINLSWTDNANNETAYKVERSPNGNNTWTVLTSTLPANTTSYSDSGLSANKEYYYRVRASNAIGNSIYSKTVNKTTAAGNAPSQLTGAPVSPNEIDLSWVDNSTNESGFYLERSRSAAFSTYDLWTLAANTTSLSDVYVYVLSAPAPDTTYYYRIKALFGDHTSVWSETISAHTPKAGLPATPSSLVAVAALSGSIASLSWTDNATNETAYKVERSPNGNNTWTVLTSTLPANTTSYSDTGLTSATTYWYRVQAVNAQGTSAYSNTSSVFVGGTHSSSSAPPQWLVFNSTSLNTALSAGCTIVDQVPQVSMTSLSCDPAVAASLNLEADVPLYFQDSLTNSVVNSDLVSVPPLSLKGAGRLIAIIDTGYDYNHPDLKSNYVGGANYGDYNGDPMDCFGYDGNGLPVGYHGSQISSAITGKGIAHPRLVGIAPEVGILAFRVVKGLNPCSAPLLTPYSIYGYSSNVLNAFTAAMNYNPKPDVIDISSGTPDVFSGYCDSDNPISRANAYTQTVNAAANRGILITAAAGNDNKSTGISLPACLRNTIAVGGVNNAGTRWVSSDGKKGSNYGSSALDIMAPAQSYVAFFDGDKVAYNEGTSFSAPIVAGAITLIKQAHQLWTTDQVRKALFITAHQPTPAVSSVDSSRYGCLWNSTYGCGIVDVCRAVNYDLNTVEPQLTNYFGQSGIFNAPSFVSTANACLLSAPAHNQATGANTWSAGPITFRSDSAGDLTLSAAFANIPASGNGGLPIDLSIAVNVGTTRQIGFDWSLSSYATFNNGTFTCCSILAKLEFDVDGTKVLEASPYYAQGWATLLSHTTYSLTPGRHILTWRLQGLGNGYNSVGVLKNVLIQ